ncbi:MAG: YlxR family protein [Lachnospiraceae bacterium]|nr:YlxR family protein [Lachnospiraceae bacterium]
MSTMNKKIPMRLCIGCGEMKSKKELMRILHTPEDTFVLDVTGKKNGRGAYLCKSEECLKRAIKSKGLERSFKMSIPKEVYAALEEEFINIEAE